MGVMTLALTFKLIFKSTWNAAQAGSIITHIGALLLLYGGLLTSVNSTEGSMVIYEGDTANYVSDYHVRELVIYDAADKKLLTRSFDTIKVGDLVHLDEVPLVITIRKVCRNCDVFKRNSNGDVTHMHGVTQDIDIQPKTVAFDDETNKSGVVFDVSGADDAINGTWLSMDIMNQAPEISVRGKQYKIVLQKKRTILPFSLTLTKFDRQYHPGTALARSFRSDVVLKDGDAHWRSVIQMNEPLRYKGYTFYQTSFVEDGDRRATVLAVVKNAGRIFPYVSGIVMCIGLLVIMMTKLPILLGRIAQHQKKIGALLFFLITAGVSVAHGSVLVDDTPFASIPVQDQGRIKPLISYAENYLMLFRGSNKLPDMSALAWLAEILFSPETAVDKDIFNIPDPAVVDALGVERHNPHYYSARMLHDGFLSNAELIRHILDVPEDRRELLQQNIIVVYNKLHMFDDLAHAMLPLRFELNGAETTTGGSSFHIVPPQWNANKVGVTWHGLNEIAQLGQGSPAARVLADDWMSMQAAYRSGDADVFRNYANNTYHQSLGMAQDAVLMPRLNLEVEYKIWQPLKISAWLYMMGLVGLLFSFVVDIKFLIRSSVILIGSGFALHGAALVVRMLIMGRPPVTNLYASIIYVGFVVVLIGLGYEWRARNKIGLFIAALAGSILQYIGMLYDVDGDTMGMLVAVLDTNFWLSTHVICITTGYACCLIGAVMAHIYLVMRVVRPTQKTMHDTLARNIRGIAYIALFFCSLGTILGGIWADQSWGRFWGWDPKENGALLICLWLLMLTHGRMGGRLHELGFTAGVALLGVIVSLSWFGVNLLGVGLHSYGFTQGAMTGLATYVLGESLFVGLTYVVIKLSPVMRK